MNILKTSLFIFVAIISACGGSDAYVPKPRAFPRLDLPKISYKAFDSSGIPYAFEIPVYAAMEKDTLNVYQIGSISISNPSTPRCTSPTIDFKTGMSLIH